MAANRVKLDAGLYFLATPIGCARDITLRALDILASADVLAAEDTRSLRRLMDIHGIALGARPVVSYHDHNGAAQRPRLLRTLSEGKSVAYASEAGTPLVADPGYHLGREATREGHLVTAAPGPSAVLAALSVSGLPTDQFFFAGFLPPAKGARQTFLRAVSDVPGTLVFYESPKRVHKSLEDMVQSYGAERPAVLARELTKKFEEVLRGTLGTLCDIARDKTFKGEVVLLIGRGDETKWEEADIEILLRDALQQASLKDAVAMVTRDTGVARRKIYQMALTISKEDDRSSS